jgi:hypothetical protein
MQKPASLLASLLTLIDRKQSEKQEKVLIIAIMFYFRTFMRAETGCYKNDRFFRVAGSLKIIREAFACQPVKA